MNQNGTPTPDPNQPNAQNNAQSPPANNTSRSLPIWGRMILFFVLFFVILLSSSNFLIATILAALVNLLSISLFDGIPGIIVTRLGRLWDFLFGNRLTNLRKWLGDRRRQRIIIDIIAIISIVILLGTTTLRPIIATKSGNLNDSVCLYTSLPWLTCDSGFGISTLPNGVRIGLIADNTTDDGPFDLSGLNQDEIQIEKLIFRENQHACTSQHITLVAVAMLSRTVDDPSSSALSGQRDLRGYYFAQHDYNATHPAVSVCLTIANLGTSATADQTSPLVQFYPDDYSLPQVIHQIAQLARTDPTFRGIVGFPYSQQAYEALNLIPDYQNLSKVPIISPAATSDDLSDKANFYRIASPDTSQGTVLAQFFCDSLLPGSPGPIAMLRDSLNPYSSSFQLAFNNALLNCGVAPTSTHTFTYTIGDPVSIQKAIDQALNQGVAYIFFSGYDQDMDTIEQEIYKKLQDKASTITIIGGDGLNNAEATTHYSYSRVYASDFVGPIPDTSPIANSLEQLESSQSPFVNNDPSSGLLWVPPDVLLSYDAIKAFTQTIESVQNGNFTQDNLDTILQTISFQGVTGQVTFQGNSIGGHISDRNQGYTYITCNDLAHNTHLIAQYSTINNGNSPPKEQPTDDVSTCS